MTTMHRILWAFGMSALAAGLSGCAGLGGSSSVSLGPDGQGQNAAQNSATNPVQWLGQLPLPPGAVFRANQSLIIGTGNNWVGRVVLDVGRDLDAAYRFFLETYPSLGWTVVSAVRGQNSFMVMTQQDRTVTIEMVDGGIMGSSVSLTMAPRNASGTVPTPQKP